MFDWQFIIAILYIYSPAMVANTAPVFVSKVNALKSLNKPIDLGSSFQGKRIFGDNKTIRGYVAGVIAAGIFGVVLSLFVDAKPFGSFMESLVYGVATGFGALAGDSVKSFFKRRVGIESGALWIPFDQIDFVIGATIIAMFFVEISVPIFIFAIIFIGILSFVVSLLGFALHIKKNL